MDTQRGEFRAAIVLFLVAFGALILWVDATYYDINPIADLGVTVAEVQVDNPLTHLLDGAHGVRGQMDSYNNTVLDASRQMDGFTAETGK